MINIAKISPPLRHLNLKMGEQGKNDIAKCFNK